MNSRIELVSTFLLGAAAVGSAWSAYQSTRWGGVQAAQYTKASSTRAESGRAFNRGLGQLQIDVSVFLSWMVARSEGSARAARHIEERFRKEFVPAFRRWMGARGADQPLPAGSPFSLPEYRLEPFVRSEQLAADAAQAYRAGQRANQIGDNFVFCVVLFSTSVFFAALPTKVSARPVRVALVVLAAVLLIGAAIGVALLPPNVGFSSG